VASVDAYDDSTAEAGLATYRSTYGLPPCTTANGCFKKVNQNGIQGSYPSNNQGWGLEISLDLGTVSAAGPGYDGPTGRGHRAGRAASSYRHSKSRGVGASPRGALWALRGVVPHRRA
jgi:hypothetical protein